MMLCSFQKPEPWQPSHAWPIPKVPSPDECESEEVKYQRFAGMADEERIRDIFISRAEASDRGICPILVLTGRIGKT
jgi:acyl-CoA thioesterase 8